MIQIFDVSMHSGVQYLIQIDIWHTKLLQLGFISAHAKGLSKFMLYSAILPIEKKLQNFL